MAKSKDSLTIQKEKSDEKLGPPINQWIALNHVLRVYKLIAVVVALVALTLSIALIIEGNRPPLVVIKEADTTEYLMGKFQRIKIDEKTVEKVVRKFIRLRYEWEDLNPLAIAQNIAPLTTTGASNKIRASLAKLKAQNFEGKSVRQSVTNIRVQITKEKVVAVFDKLLYIENLPLPVPTQVYLNVIRGTPTYWNPEGLVINGVIERQAN